MDLWLRRGSDTHPESTKTKCKAEKVADKAIQLSAGLVIWYVINRKEPKEGKTDTDFVFAEARIRGNTSESEVHRLVD